MSSFGKKLFLLFVILSLSACTLYPARKPVPIKTAPQLAPNEGFLAIAFAGDEYIEEIQINGPIKFAIKDPTRWHRDKVKLFKLPAGQYRITAIQARVRFAPTILEDERQWYYTIEPGKINYVGTLLIDGYEGYYYYLFKRPHVRNDLSMLIEQLKHRYPEIAKRYEVRFANQFEDPFLEIVNKALKETAQ